MQIAAVSHRNQDFVYAFDHSKGCFFWKHLWKNNIPLKFGLRATSSHVEQRRAMSSHVEQTVKKRRAMSSNVEQTVKKRRAMSSNVEQFSGMLLFIHILKQPLEWPKTYTNSEFLWETDAICINLHK